ncbi:DUF5696 domain-containing protein [Gracilibacillus alcaliphilus]|uniref:DUF5696 domain-containing protein n=1 Tax=Gracilibacillus alcaliphilus TaxID=1401441 RepID=UPI00195997D0|nr:DUF5696 domain-containing protein [Gracilibacillus alcaliphilus]MBM7675708.1 hypothetical protein [Gracilibacillus alcaliphilus]
MKIAKPKLTTIIKWITFLLITSAFIYLVIQNDDGEQAIDGPVTPDVPVAENTEEQDSEGAENEEVEQGEEQAEDIVPEQIEEEVAIEARAQIITEKRDEIDDHVFWIDNETYELYLKEENLSVILRDKQTGAVMYSTVKDPIDSNESWKNFTTSGVVMEYLVDTNIVVHRADMYSENPTKEIAKTDTGFIANIYYPELEIGFEVQVSLTNEGVTVDIPQESIEENSDRYKISGFYIYPFLGYSQLGERDGYMFIPDGSGALIHLKDNDGRYRQPYSEMVYGRNVGIDDPYVLSLFNDKDPFNDPENILAPVFGMVQTDAEIGYLGIIEEGEFSAQIEAYPSGAILPYNWITAKFIYRQVYNQPTSQDGGIMPVRQKNRNDFDIKIHYQFVSKNHANYMGLASTYRDYLLDNKLINQKTEEFKARVDFLGAEVEDGLLMKKDVVMTTFDEAQQILQHLQNDGVANMLSIYKGWQHKGLYGGLPVRSYRPESGLEKELALHELLDWSQTENINLFLYQDALRINMEELTQTRYKLMKKFNKRTHSDNVYGNVYQSFNYLNPASSVALLNNMKQEYQNEGVSQIALSGISNHLFSYSEGNQEFDRMATKNQYQDIIETYHQEFDLVLEQPFAYLWNETNAIIDLPTKSSDYVFTDEDIPFIALTLKGLVPMYAEYTNFQANQEEFFLQLVEQGLSPSFYITEEDPAALKNTNSSEIYSSQYERYREIIPSYYQELQAIHQYIEGARIIGHERFGSVTKVTYDNEVDIYVNYSDTEQEIDDQRIDGLSYKVVHSE